LGDTISYKSQSTTSEAYGIYLDNCDGYHVEGNVLSSSDDNNKPEYGIIINNSGGNANQIYRNTLTKIGTPINAQNINRSGGVTTGLELLCNNIIECTVNDIVVTYEESDTLNGIKRNQGKYTQPNPIPAGNLFTKGGKMYKNYTNSSSNMIYYAHYENDYITYQSKEHYLIPRLVTLNPNISNQNTGVTWYASTWESNDCPDNTGLSGDGKSKEGVEELKTLINLLQPIIDSSAIALQQKMDHGNTAALINRILAASPANYQALYNDLRNYSPYLSEKLLLALIYKQGFPRNMLINLMLVNTHVAKTYWLMDALYALQPPLTGGQLQQIENKINVFSEMEYESMRLYDLVLQRDNALNNVEMFYAHDTLATSTDSLISMLQTDPRLTAKYQLVNHYFARKDTLKAAQLFNDIPLLYSLNYKEQSEHIKYKKLFELKKQLQKEGKNFSMLNEQQQQLLLKELINPSLSLGEMNDLNALRQVKDVVIGKGGKGRGKSLSVEYEEPILAPIENKEKDMENPDNTENEDLLMESLLDKALMNENSLFLYPNPAYNEVNILYNAGTDESNITIEISDVTGRSIKTYTADKSENILKINTQMYNKGIYYVILVADGKRQKVEKLVIQ
jgi:hypothetical protein